MNMTKLKQIGFIALVAMGTSLVLATLAKRNTVAAKVQQKVANGL